MTTGPTDEESTTAAGGPGGMPAALRLSEGLGISGGEAMKYKTSELTGALLDAAVAKAAGMSFEVVPQKVWGDGSGITIVYASPACRVGHRYFEPSMLWADGGPIIEREKIAVWHGSDRAISGDGWTAEVGHSAELIFGETPLVAAMRAFVFARHGEVVDL